MTAPFVVRSRGAQPLPVHRFLRHPVPDSAEVEAVCGERWTGSFHLHAAGVERGSLTVKGSDRLCGPCFDGQPDPRVRV